MPEAVLPAALEFFEALSRDGNIQGMTVSRLVKGDPFVVYPQLCHLLASSNQ